MKLRGIKIKGDMKVKTEANVNEPFEEVVQQ